MKETIKKVVAFAVLGYAVLFVLVNVDSTASAMAAVVALTLATVGGLVFVRRHGKNVAELGSLA